MKKFGKIVVPIAAATVLAVSLSGCATSEGEEENGRPYPTTHYTFYQELPSGEKVLCIWAKAGYGGGLSCDWAGKN